MTYHAQTFDIPEIAGISQKQIEEHLKLYEGYVTHVNKIYTELSELAQNREKNGHLMQELRRRLGFEFNGMRLHEIYFGDLVGGPQALSPESKLFEALKTQFGGLEAWRDAFTATAARGSGWIILNWDPVVGRFHNNWVTNHDEGQLATLPAVLALDFWEHAYLLDYVPGEKGTYLNAYLDALNWETVAARFDALT
ncbi:superoxide dismutase [Patescibacteria group bacterium]|jgi:Fe-Mn family superoxide dismutase|nr:superoxide dismutase [Patescibacteria group bacterium]